MHLFCLKKIVLHSFCQQFLSLTCILKYFTSKGISENDWIWFQLFSFFFILAKFYTMMAGCVKLRHSVPICDIVFWSLNFRNNFIYLFIYFRKLLLYLFYGFLIRRMCLIDWYSVHRLWGKFETMKTWKEKKDKDKYVFIIPFHCTYSL